jgi:phosphoribosylformimino-5-aminoimidazole carboxamide ribotide isomerase
MIVIPAIDILEGRCVRLHQGDYQNSQVFSDDPVAMAKSWVGQGAEKLHLVDLDGAKQGRVVNGEVIAAITRQVEVPIQMGGGIRSQESVAQILDLGIRQVILGTAALKQPELVTRLCQEFPGQIIIGIDARNGLVATDGWLETSETPATGLGQWAAQVGAAAIVYTDIHRDGTMAGPNLDALREMASQVEIPVIASGGISSITNLLSLLALEPVGVVGAIVGKALYTGHIDLRAANQAVGNGRIQDVPLDLGFSSFA